MPRANYYGLIMAGGRGTRFWPQSRKTRSKQVLRFFGDQSLIHQTVERLRPVLPPEHIWIITNEFLRDEVVRQLPQVPRNQIIAEPAQRGTAPCIGVAAHILQSVDPNAVMGVFPADHLILKPARYLRLLRRAFRSAAEGRMTVLGIQPKWVETGYGYIEFPKNVKAGSLELIPVRSFSEKPKKAVAKEYVRAGNYFWNAGMFFWRADVYLEALRLHQSKTATVLAALPRFTDKAFSKAFKDCYALCDAESVDRGVLERAGNIVGLAADDIGWSDVGSWNSVYQLADPVKDGNVARSEAVFERSTGNFVDAGRKFVALLGIRNVVVVDTPDALLIADRNKSQDVGKIVERLEAMKRDDLL